MVRITRRPALSAVLAALLAPALCLGVGAQALAATPDPTPAPGDSSSSTPSGELTGRSLAEAVEADLGMSLTDYDLAALASQRLTAAQPDLAAHAGYVGVEMDGAEPVVLTSAPDAGLVAEAEAAGVSVREAAVTSHGAQWVAQGSAEAAAITDQLVGANGVVSIGFTSGGSLTVTVVAAALTDPAAYPVMGEITALQGDFANISVVEGEPFEAASDADVVGGAAIALETNWATGSFAVCSLGFTGTDSAGRPVIVTAGHCAQSGLRNTAQLLVPSSQPAGGGSAAVASHRVGSLRSWVYNQAGTGGDTDISVYAMDYSNPVLNPRPAVTTWQNAADLSQSTVPVLAVTQAQLGGSVCRSGRTTGWRCGQVVQFGTATISGAPVYGFEATAIAQSGDSGGSVVSGPGYAVGITSGYLNLSNHLWAADLSHALQYTDVTITTHQAIYRFYKPSSGTHFYTNSDSEAAQAATYPDYRYEGVSGFVPRQDPGNGTTTSLYRFYKPASGTHFYTADAYEASQVMGYPEYRFENSSAMVFKVQVANSVPMYRFYKLGAGTHFYTASEYEKNQVLTYPGYKYEGVAYYLYPAS